jgi:hypothetical protein
MKPVEFEDVNTTYVGGEGIALLPVYRGGGMIISCWRPSWREVLRVVLTRRVWVAVLGDVLPPFAVAADPVRFSVTEGDGDEG